MEVNPIVIIGLGICIGINLLIIPLLLFLVWTQRQAITALKKVMSKEQIRQAITGIEEDFSES